MNINDSPHPVTTSYVYSGMKNLVDAAPCIADYIVDCPLQWFSPAQIMDAAVSEGLDGYVIKAELRVTAIAKVNRDKETVEIYDGETMETGDLPATGEPIPMKDFARKRDIKIAFEEQERSSCCCGLCADWD